MRSKWVTPTTQPRRLSTVNFLCSTGFLFACLLVVLLSHPAFRPCATVCGPQRNERDKRRSIALTALSSVPDYLYTPSGVMRTSGNRSHSFVGISSPSRTI